MMAITTSNSISVKPREPFERCDCPIEMILT